MADILVGPFPRGIRGDGIQLNTSGSTVPGLPSARNERPEQIFEIGKYYNTVGGWEAVIVWIRGNVDQPKEMTEEEEFERGGFRRTTPMIESFLYYAVHRPFSNQETGIIIHDYKGKPYSTFSVNDPPLFCAKHPATLLLSEIKNMGVGKLQFLKELFKKNNI